MISGMLQQVTLVSNLCIQLRRGRFQALTFVTVFLGTGFDDGPYLGSSMLYDFLEEKHIGATHFMIGMYIRADPATFVRAFNMEGADIAVHTYSHLYMTTLSNEDVLAQLAWTMQIIHDTTGGRVPRYWRPPYGDADNRVRAIAKEVLGMQIIMWNQE